MTESASRLRPALVARRAASTLAWPIAIACAEARAADLALPSMHSLGPHLGWMVLAGLGLVAVVAAAFTVRRTPKGMRSLMDITTELREVPATTISPKAPPMAAAAAAIDVAGASPAPENPPRPETPAIAIPLAAPTILAPAPPPHGDDFVTSRDGSELEARPAEPEPSDAAGGSQLFLALHHVDLSIEVLRRHLVRETRPMPAVWLMLLDLARTHGREQTFSELALEFHRRFNVCTPQWEGFPPGRDEPGLEAYPRLVKEITLTWGTHECRRLLDRLLYDNRGGNRRGFTLNAYNDLIALRRAADAVIDTIEQDLAEEAKVRSAFESASAEMSADDGDAQADRSPLVRDLESQLDSDLRTASQPKSALEREHPALAGMLAREWGNAALAARLCEMLARGGDGAQSLSREATEELELLRAMAERLAGLNGVPVLTDEAG